MKTSYLKTFTLVLFFALFCGTAMSQKIPAKFPKLPIVIDTAKKDSVKKDSVKKIIPRSSIKAYSAVITKAFKSQMGLFGVHQSKDIVYFEIPDSILQQDIMLINRLNKVGAGTGMYAGEELDEKTIQFEKGRDSTIRIKYDLVVNEADTGSNIYKAVIRSSQNPTVLSFPIVAFGKNNKSYVIDATKYLKEKGMVNAIDPGTTLAKNANVISMKDFNIESIHVYPINVEVSISKNLDPKSGGTGLSANPLSIETHTSFIALPKQPLQRRYFDPRVGYFADYYNAFADDQQKVEQRKFILRWRLEPKDADMEKWKRGELVEPKKQIVIYIDPAAPKQWRPYLIAGVNDWQKAFEQAGFKNAIIGKEWPENDTTMHMDDARYSMLNYFPSEVANAYGPQVHDPRSGEIIQTHIGWYHNVMSLLHDWYMIQASATDPEARKAKFDDKLMGELIRFVSSHEIGHTLGLRHNFGSSSKTPVDSLRSKHYLDIHGHTASIMDYARFNYVAQPEDHIPQNDLFPRIGEYDKWAIEWGYKYSGAANADEDKKIVGKWIVDRTSKNPRLWFGDGETKKFDPRCQTEDLGDDAAKASTYGIKNLQRIMPNLPKWTHEDDGINESLASMYKALTSQYFRYMGHVLKYIGGVYGDIKSEEQAGPVYTPATKAKQQEALAFFNKQLFDTPYWLMNTAVLDKVNVPGEPIDPLSKDISNFIEDTQVKVLNSLLDVNRLNKLLESEKQFGAKAYPVSEYMITLHKGIWKELKAPGVVKIDSYRRNLQKSYFGALLDILSSKDAQNSETDISSMVKADMYFLQDEVKQAIPRTRDPMTLFHLKDLQSRIKSAMNPKGGA
ncbi:zinc-dependent metalloprotease [Mucilaginibacter sp.]|uniref:zinc-dependent metalloprotease n=1 Tax=Mucilaginibacter sp. TaxID=1882438 RepID=UPI0032670F6B